MWWRRLRYLLLLIALCAIATCPSAKRSCTSRARAREADELLAYLADRVAAVIAATGRVPSAPAGPTPSPGCCERGGGACDPDLTLWATRPWQALGFSVDGAHRYTYSYVPAADGTSAIVRAVGDLDCDGITSTSEIEVSMQPTGVRRKATHTNLRE